MPPPSPPQAGRSASSSSPYGGGSNMLMSVASTVSWRKTRAAAEGWAPSGKCSWLDSSERCQAFASFHAAARSTSATEVFDTAAVVTAASARSHDLSATAGPGGVGGASGLHQAHLDAPVAAVERCRGRWRWFFPLVRFFTPPEATNTTGGFNRGSGGGARGCGFEERVGHMRVQRGVISFI